MTGKHRVSHLAIMMSTVEPWFSRCCVYAAVGGQGDGCQSCGERGPAAEDAGGGVCNRKAAFTCLTWWGLWWLRPTT